MSTRSLPPRPNLDHLKRQSHELQRAHRDGQRSAAARVVAHHPEFRGLPLDDALARRLSLAEAQLVIAREYGFRSWTRLKQHVDVGAALARFRPHPRFDEAVAAMDAGDVGKLRQLLAAHPDLVHARTNLDPQFGYFAGATLLHHVAGNPDRGRLDGALPPLPENSVAIARTLLDAGADVHARTLGTNGGDTMGLLLTSKQASDAGVVGPLVDVLREYGARVDVSGEDCLDGSLANHAPRAAEKLIELGAKPDLLAAAALGHMDLLRSFFDADGRLLARPRRAGKELSDRDAVGLAALYAYVREQREALDFLLEKDGNWNMTGVNNGGLLHRAAIAGDLALVQRLIEKGADVSNRDNPFGATPLSWADEGKQDHVFQWLRQHAAIDIHDAATFDLREIVERRIAENPHSVNERRDQWDIPQATPLHCAADQNRLEIARLLLQHGADPDMIAGNGYTPLDVADFQQAHDVVVLLEERGAVRAVSRHAPSVRAKLQPFEDITRDILTAYRSDDAAARQRIEEFYGREFSWSRFRSDLQSQLGKSADAEVTLDDVQGLFAHQRGFGSWAELARSVTQPGPRAKSWALPLYTIDTHHDTLQVRHGVTDDEWDEVVRVLSDQRIGGLDANGQMTDAALGKLLAAPHLRKLNLGGSARVTDDGLLQLAGLSRIEELDLSQHPGGHITDRGLEVLRHLPELTRFQVCWRQGISDAGVAHLAACARLENVDLLGTDTGDGALRALAGKPQLRRLKTGRRVTDAGLALLHEVPRFKQWHGGDITYSMMAFEAEPNHLLLDGPFTNRGIAGLAGLDGLIGLTFFWHISEFTADGLAPLAQLANLAFLGCEGRICDDVAMRHIAAMPRLRMLMAQGAVATDDGFAALSRSRTIEYIWGRECPNLASRGFAALAAMPALRGLAVSCKNVDDAALATLSEFPALRELMPMDVQDAGFRHVGRCHQLEQLWCMYCRDTTDAATEHIAGLSRLKTYYAGHTKITDRSLEMLSRMASLEKVEFWSCAGITNAGAARLASLPNLRELSFGGCRQVTPAVRTMFPPHIRVTYWP